VEDIYFKYFFLFLFQGIKIALFELYAVFVKHFFIGAVGLVWFSIWWIVVKSGPEEDPRISPQELKYIQDSLGNTLSKVI
jgi:hypothetical protein